MATTIHELLHLIRGQKGALLGRKSAETLAAFLEGFAFARREVEDSAGDRFLAAFNDWVRKRFGIQSAQGWAKVIAFHCNDDSEELDLFWRLYDQYSSRRHPNGRQPKGKKNTAAAKAGD